MRVEAVERIIYTSDIEHYQQKVKEAQMNGDIRYTESDVNDMVSIREKARVLQESDYKALVLNLRRELSDLIVVHKTICRNGNVVGDTYFTETTNCVNVEHNDKSLSKHMEVVDINGHFYIKIYGCTYEIKKITTRGRIFYNKMVPSVSDERTAEKLFRCNKYSLLLHYWHEYFDGPKRQIKVKH